MFGNKRQKFERGVARVLLLTALPLAHEPRRYVEITGEHRLALLDDSATEVCINQILPQPAGYTERVPPPIHPTEVR